MLVSSSTQILPAVTDPNNFYVGMYNTTAGRITSQFASPSLTFNPSANVFAVNGSLVVSNGVFYANGVAFSSGGTFTGGTITTSIIPSSNVTINLGSTTNWFGNIYGTSTHALYADLAENYTADVTYAPGTVVVFGGTAEVTISTVDHDSAVAGVVSTDPAYLMNSDSNGLPIALQGRVPCQVQGPVAKGTVLVTGTTPGVAQAIDNAKFVPGCVIGKALAAINTDTIETIEVVVGKH